MESAPAPPLSVSSPAPPKSMLAALLPVSMLSSVLPLPSMATDPVKIRFSTLSDKIHVKLEKIRSIPSFKFSITISPMLSTRNESLPSPPVMESAPAAPFNVSSPAPPKSVLAALLPVIELSSEFPVPLMAAKPFSVRFSTFSPSVKEMLALTSSIPSLKYSMTESDALSIS